jgi:hypothetical protein
MDSDATATAPTPFERTSCEHPFVVSTQASLYADFRRGLRNRNLPFAESAARQLGQLSVEDALDYCCLLAERDPARYERAALRWHARLVAEAEGMTLLRAQIALATLKALPRSSRVARDVLAGLVAGR